MRTNGEAHPFEDGRSYLRRWHPWWLVGAIAASLLEVGVAMAGAPGPEPEESLRAAGPEQGGELAETPGAALPDTPVMSATPPIPSRDELPPRPVLDPSARLLTGDDASEAWTLFVELESGHRITQRFLLTNVGPGEHSAVAIGHLVTPGRAPYRYKNGRRRHRWTLSEDALFFDIAASHLDLHRPKGELRITKDDIEIRLFFDFAAQDPSARIPDARLPPGYHVEVLAIGAETTGSILAPWMSGPLETRGRTWLVHTWTNKDEADLLARRVDVFGQDNETSFYGIRLEGRGDWKSASSLLVAKNRRIIESSINVPGRWIERGGSAKSAAYPIPEGFQIREQRLSGRIDLASEWLRFDPLEVIPQPFRWFIRRSSQPLEVWADARIGVSISSTPGAPSLPHAGETSSVKTVETSRSKRETEDESAERSVTGVASITFLNPMSGR